MELRQQRELTEALEAINPDRTIAVEMITDVLITMIEVEGTKAFDDQEKANDHIAALRVARQLVSNEA